MTTEKPILFTDEMVRAILEDRKVITRRAGTTWADVQPGTVLWVRECWALRHNEDRHPIDAGGHPCAKEDAVRLYRASGDDVGDGRWVPSIHMPRWACRLTLKIKSVVEEPSWGYNQVAPDVWLTTMPMVTEDEARREGFESREAFLALWSKLHPNYRGPVQRVAFRRIP